MIVDFDKLKDSSVETEKDKAQFGLRNDIYAKKMVCTSLIS